MREISKRMRDICPVILSADESREIVLALLNAGATAYVRKGLSGPVMGAKLTESLKARRTVSPA